MRNKRNRGWLYIGLAILLGILVESHQSHPFSIASVLGAAVVCLLMLAILGEIGFWIWTKISN
jgi:hypothetical protein